MRLLNLFVNNKHVARLHEEPSPTGRPQYRITYLPNITQEDYLSLSLPVSTEPYVVDDIPFALRQNFPEGNHLLRLKVLGKVVDISDNFGVLSIVGASTVGRVSVSTTQTPPAGGIPMVNLHDATERGKLLFEALYAQYGGTQGISGIQEKVLGNSTGWHHSLSAQARVTSDKFILKSFNPERFPALAENEYWTTLAAKHCGITASETFVTNDFTTLIVGRFDVLPDGSRLALDEIGALAGFSNDQKYLASYETVADMIFQYCSNPYTDALAFFKQIAFMVAVKNGDAHLKNFALLSGDGRTRLAPAYDLVCTGVYVDEARGEFENPGMPLENSRWEKRWWNKDTLLSFGEQTLGLNHAEIAPIFDQIESGLNHTLEQMHRTESSMEFVSFVKPRLDRIWTHPFDLEGYGDIPTKRIKPKKPKN